MTPISTRFLGPAGVVLLVAAAFVGALELRPHRVDPCARPGELALTHQIPGVRGPEPVDFGDSADLVLRARGSIDNPYSPAAPLRFQLVRSYDLVRMSGRPVSLVSQKVEAENHSVIERTVGGRVLPVHLVEDHTSQPSLLIAYLQVHGLEPSAYPMSDQLARGGEVLRLGSPVITTMIIAGPMDRPHRQEVEARALEWIDASWTFFDRRCSPE